MTSGLCCYSRVNYHPLWPLAFHSLQCKRRALTGSRCSTSVWNIACCTWNGQSETERVEPFQPYGWADRHTMCLRSCSDGPPQPYSQKGSCVSTLAVEMSSPCKATSSVARRPVMRVVDRDPGLLWFFCPVFSAAIESNVQTTTRFVAVTIKTWLEATFNLSFTVHVRAGCVKNFFIVICRFKPFGQCLLFPTLSAVSVSLLLITTLTVEVSV